MRKHKTYHVTFENRDKGKKFRITEMSANQAERWAAQVFTELLAKGVIEEERATGGIFSLGLIGLRSLYQIDLDKQMLLLDKLFECIEVINEDGSFRKFEIDVDVEEEVTLTLLRIEVFNFHVSFLQTRRPLEVSSSGARGDLRSYPNVPQPIGTAVSSGLATLAELDTVYGVEDLYDLLEVAIIDAHNQREAMKNAK